MESATSGSAAIASRALGLNSSQGGSNRPARPGHLHQPSQNYQHVIEKRDRTMTGFKGHRIIIASLFLPVTVSIGRDEELPGPAMTFGTSSVILQDPPKPTPTGEGLMSIATKRLSLQEGGPNNPNAAKRLSLTLREPYSSILDDLAVKSRPGTPAATPAAVPSKNPFQFQSLTGVAAGTPNVSVTPTTSSGVPTRQSQSTTHPPKLPDIAESVFESINIKSSPINTPQSLRHRSSTSSIGRHKSKRARSTSTNELLDTPLSPDGGVHFDSNPHGNGGLYNAVRSVENKLSGLLWVGALGQRTDMFAADVRRRVDRGLMNEHDCKAVWVEDKDFSECYDVFCHQVLWPCLHYAIPDAPKNKNFYESESFKHYKAVNQGFADAIVAEYEEGDIVWINDYHLMLVAQMVREKIPSANIGFFMHVAFPSSEIFRCLAVRRELLQGVLAADLIGFQTANFVRHFRQTVSRLLSVETSPKGIQLDNKFVDVAVFPMGIDVGSLNRKRKAPEVIEWVNLLKQRYSGMKLVVGRDKLDETQGVRQKLLGFEMFLQNHPEFQGKAVLIQVALQTSEENEVHSNVSDIVSRINSAFSSLTYQPIVFLHTQDLTFNQYLALLIVADVFLVTSLREGMALRTHEYVECQEATTRPLILSEFTGSYSFSGFRSCIPVNPYDSRGIAEAINQGLTMPDDEALSRWKDLHSHVNTQTAQSFVSSFLNRLMRVHGEQQMRPVESIEKFNTDLIIPRYRHSGRRLILLDYEDTLWLREPGKRELTHEPPKDALEVLKALSSDKRNQVWLLSGFPIKGALDKVAAAVPAIGICAENGCFIKPQHSSEWVNMITNFNLAWKAPCMEILNYFVERTPGSWIEEREATIIFRFYRKGEKKDKDAEDWAWARRQAAEAQNHIYDSLGERYSLRIIPGATAFLVLPNNVSRSSAVGTIMQPGGVQGILRRPTGVIVGDPEYHLTAIGDEMDFVLCIGGDQKLLRGLNDLDNSETVTTSSKGSDATWRLRKEEVRASLFATYRVTDTLWGTGFAEGLAGDGQYFAIFTDGRHRQLPRLTRGPFKYKTYAADLYKQFAALNRGGASPKQAIIAPSMLYLLHHSLKKSMDTSESSSRRIWCALRKDPNNHWTGRNMLNNFIALNNRLLDRFTPVERANIGVHTCPGGDSTDSGDVPYISLLSTLFDLHTGYFLIQLASEKDKESVYRDIGKHLKKDQVAFIGVIDPLNRGVETPEEVAVDLVLAAKYIPKEQLGATDDWGFSPFSIDVNPKHGSLESAREVAFKKIEARIAGAELVSKQLGF